MKKLNLNVTTIGIANAVMLLLVSLFKEVRLFRPLHSVFQILLLVGILVGGLVIGYNFFDQKEKTLFDKLSYGLVITLVISSVLSPQWRSESIKDSAVTGICVLAIFPLINGLYVHKKHRFSLNVIRLIMICVTIISFASIVLFFISPLIQFDLLGETIKIGMSTNRLFGLYHSLSLPIAASSLILGFSFRFNPLYVNSTDQRFLFISNLIVNFVFVALSFSYGVIIALIVSVAYVSFFGVLKLKKKVLVAILVAVFAASAFGGALYVTRVGIFAVRNVSDTGGTIEDPDEPQVPDDIWKEQHYGILTGRDTIWLYGLTHLKERPLIGFGAAAFYGDLVLGTQELQSLHNVYVQSLVSGGIIHSVFSFWVIGLIVIRSLRYSIKSQQGQHYMYNLALIGLLVFSVIGGFVETNLLYVNRFPQYIFWICLSLLTFNVSKPRYDEVQ
ncbi:hypothetical protein AOC36_02565 [Erysipelothrix larvae]|uniref:O-antigen ligase-related domain-containing protein n=1 Tax=Erysipelothrix larvae TaxID=1514105 RepID=A0A0X8GYU3_9FIRM|nr:O-antigen ligase family protein [Erysipelothrix larvae]AMC92905.1 hypothetical protein AOC36_02565 [Erysipelothrix larvae]